MKKMTSVMSLVVTLAFLAASCGGPDYQSAMTKDKDKEKPKRTADRGTNKLLGDDELKKKLSPKTPEDAIKGFLNAYFIEYNGVKSYAYLSKMDYKELSKNTFLQSMGQSTEFHRIIMHVFKIEKLTRKPGATGSYAMVTCRLTLPDLKKITVTMENIIRNWEKNPKNKEGRSINDQQLFEELKPFLVTDPKDPKGKKTYKVPAVTITFDAMVLQEDGHWWVRYKDTWKNLKKAYEMGALKLARQ